MTAKSSDTQIESKRRGVLPPGEGWTVYDMFSISYTEVLELSYDVEKGRLRGLYGLPGDGLNFQLWKDRPR